MSRLLAAFSDRYEPEPTTGCWLWTGLLDRDGYGLLSLGASTAASEGFSYSVQRAHRVSLYIATGQHAPKGSVVLHACDTPACVNPAHLRIGTHAENIAERGSKGRTARGERMRRWRRPHGEQNKRAVLTEAAVRTIRQLHAEGTRTHGEIAALFNVSRPAISAVLRRRTWGHVA